MKLWLIGKFTLFYQLLTTPKTSKNYQIRVAILYFFQNFITAIAARALNLSAGGVKHEGLQAFLLNLTRAFPDVLIILLVIIPIGLKFLNEEKIRVTLLTTKVSASSQHLVNKSINWIRVFFSAGLSATGIAFFAVSDFNLDAIWLLSLSIFLLISGSALFAFSEKSKLHTETYYVNLAQQQRN